MKPFGPYVAARELPGGTGVVRTLRATERLTGMPVLLHVLPYAMQLPDLPAHPNLLPIVDGGMQDEEAYVVSELPLQASLATDPLLAARGALSALEALHARGLVHGGVSATQLWSVDGQVSLAGAGLPWRSGADPHDDLRDLMQALRHIGVFPRALKAVQEQPEAWTAAQALALLDAPPVAEQGAAPPSELPVNAGDAPEPPVPHPEVPVPVDVPAPAGQEPLTVKLVEGAAQVDDPAGVVQEQPGKAPEQSEALPPPKAAEDASPVLPESSGAPGTNPVNPSPAQAEKAAKAGRAGRKKQRWAGLVHAPSPGVDGQTAPPAAERVPPGIAAVPAGADVAEGTTPAVPAEPPTSPAPQLEEPAAQQTADATPGEVQGEAEGSATPETTHPVQAADPAASHGRPVPAFSSAPAGTTETPQERRRRQNEERREQAMLDAKAAAERKAKRLREEAAARQAQGEDGPVRIGLADDLPAWDAPASGDNGAADAPRRLQMRTVERLPATLRRPVDEREPPAPPPLTIEEQPAVTAAEAGHLPARRYHGEPIRIGWDEDDSWRVVKPAPPLPEGMPRRVSGWAWLVLAALLLVGLVWAWRALGTTSATSANRGALPAAQANCCVVQFRVSGGSGKTAKISVLEAPAAARLKVGQALGSAPGTIRFPVRGAYRLQVSVPGYTPNSLRVRVPEDSPVEIGLGE